MALVRSGGGVTDIRGSISGNTFSRNRGGMIVRARTVPTNTRSSSQQKSRTLFSKLTENWHSALTDSQRTAWTTYANAIASKNKLGETVHLTGQLHFIRTNQARMTAGISLIKIASKVLSLPETDPSITIVGFTLPFFVVSFDESKTWCFEYLSALSVLVSRPQIVTKNYFNGPWRFAGSIRGSTANPPHSPTAIPLPFPISLNQQLFSKVEIIRRDGRVTNPFKLPPKIFTLEESVIFVADCFNCRIVKRLSEGLGYVTKIGTNGAGNDQFTFPRGVCNNGAFIYVADTNNHRIVKRLASDLSYISKIGTQGIGNDQFDTPSRICTDGIYIYVADTNNHRIVKRLASDLSYISKIGTQGIGNDQFNFPLGIDTDGTYVYVADTSNHRIVKRLASDLSYIFKIGTQGSGDDQFNQPHSISVSVDYIYVADTINCRIVKRLASDLSYVAKIGTLGEGDDEFGYPKGVEAIVNYIYVADFGNQRIVKRLSSDLSYVSKIGHVGSCNDCFDDPWDVQ